MRGSRVLPFYAPPTLIMRQVAALTAFKVVTKWTGLSWWARHALKLCRISAGAMGIGCFGYPIHPVYEVTLDCNLRCIHCHVRGGERIYEELSTDEAKKAIRNLMSVKEFRTLVFTGGEPLVREDIYGLMSYASSLGFYTVLATNATLITEEAARKLRKAKVRGIAASLDFIDAEKHDAYRGSPGAFDAALKGIANARNEGMYIQINITASRRNFDQIEGLLKLADQIGAHVVLLYQLIPVGRGETLFNEAFNSEAFASLMARIRDAQSFIRPVVIPVGLPEYFVFLMRSSRLNPKLASAFKGCIAGRGMFYIKPNGDVWPCTFLPLKAGNLLENSASEIWRSPLFDMFRSRENLKGPCGMCEYVSVCGGCRARAYAYTGDPLAYDPCCPYAQNRPSIPKLIR